MSDDGFYKLLQKITEDMSEQQKKTLKKQVLNLQKAVLESENKPFKPHRCLCGHGEYCKECI